MQDIYNILIQNGIIPAWVDETTKMRFSQWVDDINDHNITTFTEFLTQAQQQTQSLTDELDKVRVTCQEMIKNATAALDRALSDLTDVHASLQSHLQLLERWIPLHDAQPSLLTALETAEAKNHKSLCSQPFIMEMIMRRIALQITAKEPFLLSQYQRFAEDPLPGEVIDKKIDCLRILAIELGELLSRGINNTSNVIAAINKGLSAPTEYTNLLHRLMVELHDIQQKISSEVPLCQNI